jgi:protein O-mannosyl-transferase
MYNIKPKYCYIIIAIFTFALFYNTLENDFVFDDESVVQNNTALQNLSNIPKYFTAQEGFHKVIGKYYRPIVSTTYTIDYALWGLTPKGFHFTNLLIHLIACLLLFTILKELFKNYKYGIFASLISVLIFSAHPIHTEAVSWISGRTDSLVTLFFFASFLYYIKFDDNRRNSFLIVSLVFYVLGLLSKEMIITMPVIVFLYGFIYKKKKFNEIIKNWKTYFYFILVSIIYLYIRYLVLKDVPDRDSYLYFYGQSITTAIATMLKTVPIYFKLLFYPVNLLYHYNGTVPDAHSFFEAQVIIAEIFILVLIFSIIYFYKKDSIISFCIAFFVITLLPVMNIIPTMNFMAERFLYLASFALSVVIAYLISKYINEKKYFPFFIISLLVIIILSYLTFQRNAEWKNNDTLYSTAEGIDGSVLLVNVGNIYANKKQFDEAEIRYRKAIEIRDNNLLAHHNLGQIFLIKGKLDSAEIKFKKGIEIDSLAPDGYFQLSNLYQQEGRNEEAIKQLERLQTISPDYRGSKEVLSNLKLSGMKGQNNIPPNIKPPVAHNEKLSMLEKRSYEYYQNKKFKEAVKDIEEMIEINPSGKSGYYNNIALCYEGMNDPGKVKEYYTNALNIDDKNVNALGGIAGIYLRNGDVTKAKSYYEKILAINPGDLNAKTKLDSLNRK